MFNELSLIIIREIFRRIHKDDLLKFKLITKRIFNFITNDRVCQCVYLQKTFNLSFESDTQNLNEILDSKKYLEFLTQKRLLWKTRGYFIFIRPQDDALLTIYKNDSMFVMKSNIDFTEIEDLDLIQENCSFEDKIINDGFIMINPKFYDRRFIAKKLHKLHPSSYDKGGIYKTRQKFSSSHSKIHLEFITREYSEKRFKIILKQLLN